MRIDNGLFYFSFLFAISIMKLSKPRVEAYYESPSIYQINTIFKKDMKELSSEIAAFNTLAIQFNSSNVSEKALKEGYKKLRMRFKKVSFLLEYLDKEAFDKSLNGAPLPKIEPKVSDPVILKPKGLQVIDELMAASFTDEISKLLIENTRKLKADFTVIHSFLLRQKLTDRQFFEASRQAVLRLTALGITGFDTPGTLLGVADATTVLSSLQTYFAVYKKELKNVSGLSYYNHLHKVLSKAQQHTKTANFENFDRVTFIKKYANPLYKTIKDIHVTLEYETIDEVSRYPLAVNYGADNIFQDTFLNPYYYVSIAQDTLVKDAAQLGKLLFYDPILSKNNKMACASCHAPEKAFTDGRKTSISNKGTPVKRNAMTLNYTVYASGFFYDLRTKRLEDQFEHVVFNEDEFNNNYQNIIVKLKESKHYQSLFTKAFPNQKNTISSNTIDYALTAYVMGLNSFDSKIDTYFLKENQALTEQERLGFNLFAGKAACATCHFIPTFSGLVPPLYIDSETEVLGVPNHKDTPTVLDDDIGRGANGLTKEVAPFYRASFKTPTLRNISKTAPYMHNGVFDTLEEVMDFYNNGGGAGQGMVIEHQTLAEDALNLTDHEIDAIIAFIKSLTDQSQVFRPESIPTDFSTKEFNERKLVR